MCRILPRSVQWHSTRRSSHTRKWNRGIKQIKKSKTARKDHWWYNWDDNSRTQKVTELEKCHQHSDLQDWRQERPNKRLTHYLALPHLKIVHVSPKEQWATLSNSINHPKELHIKEVSPQFTTCIQSLKLWRKPVSTRYHSIWLL